jgi:hypothetical protein
MPSVLTEITGDAIERWADTAVAPTSLPDLVRRLLLATAPLEFLKMPSHGGAWQGGFDGVVATREAGAFWPAGPSVWEMSISAGVKRKLDRDYKNRVEERPAVERQRTTYVAVTARRFEPAKWTSELKSRSEWADIRVVDADDIAAWLTLAPAVAVWFASEHLGAPASDLTDVDSYLRAWSQRTRPPLPPSLALSRRQEALDAFRARLEGDPAPIRIAADTREEAVVFAAAAIALDKSLLAERRKVRTVVAHTEAALRWAVEQRAYGELIFLPTIAPVAATTHGGGVRVLVALEPDAATTDVDVRLGPISRQDIVTALLAAGVGEEASRRLAAESEGRLSALQRRMGYGYVERPEWARGEATAEVMAMLLVGAFASTNPADREVLDGFGVHAAQVEALCARLQHATGAPIVKKGDIFTWASHGDVWGLLARELTTMQIDAFLFAAEAVLGEDDPGLALSVEKRFYAPLLGQVLRHSNALRAGMARSLARLAHAPDAVASGRGARLAERAVIKILAPEWHRWATLGELLGPIAEAAPVAFLNLLEASLQTGEAGVSHLFNEETPFRNLHTGVLWTLERLAWLSEHLSRVVLVLARLAERDPGGSWGNRPARSLHGILHERLPQSFTAVGQRITLMKLIAERHPNVAWSLCLSVLSTMGMLTNHPRPDFVPVSNSAPPMPPNLRDLRAQQTAALELLTALAGDDGQRWSRLLDAASQLEADDWRPVFSKLESVQLADPLVLWNHLRSAKSLAGRRSDAVLVSALETLYVRFTPTDPVESKAWLFSGAADFESSSAGSFPERRLKAHAARMEAIEQLLALEKPWVAVRRLGVMAALPGMVGEALAESSRAADAERELLATSDEAAAKILPMLLARRSVENGLPWFLDRLKELATHGRVLEAANAASRCSPTIALWRGLDAVPALAVEYWKSVRLFGQLEPDGWSIAIDRLVKAQRSHDAVMLADAGGMEAPALASMAALSGLAEALRRGERVRGPDATALEYHVERVLDRVAADSTVSPDDIAGVELVFSLGLRMDSFPARLSASLERSCEMFVYLVSLVYRAEDEVASEAEADESARNSASNASRLLHDWHGCPGRTAAGADRDTELMDWCEKALTAFASIKRLAVGSREVARVLARAPVGPDGIWPCVPARRLLGTGLYTELRDGLRIAKYNKRGVVRKALGEGGNQEAVIADLYTEWARELEGEWPETATLLKDMAREHSAEAAHAESAAAVLRDDYDLEPKPVVATQSLPDIEAALRVVLSNLPGTIDRLAYILDVDPGGGSMLVVYVLLADERSAPVKRDIEGVVRDALGIAAQGAYFRWRSTAEHDAISSQSRARRPVEVRR